MFPPLNPVWSFAMGSCVDHLKHGLSEQLPGCILGLDPIVIRNLLVNRPVVDLDHRLLWASLGDAMLALNMGLVVIISAMGPSFHSEL